MKSHIVRTEDGSDTLLSSQFGVHYHSTFGAIQESRHIFIEAAFKYLSHKRENVSILEVGFGSGLNALLTFMESETSKVNVDYTGIEAYPINHELVLSLNYCDQLNREDLIDSFLKFHQCSNKKKEFSEYFKFNLILDKFELVELNQNAYDIVYFDAFDPEVQAELWSESMFEKLFHAMKEGGVLTTYSCKGIVKRALKSAGFRIEKIPGPPGKREILRAIKE